MKKEEIYVKISTHDEQKRAIEILTKVGEKIKDVNTPLGYRFLMKKYNNWYFNINKDAKTQISFHELEQLLTLSIDKEIESFKERMKERGFEISVVIEKEIINPDDVVMYWDDTSGIRSFIRYVNLLGSHDNIVKVTDEHILKFLNL